MTILTWPAELPRPERNTWNRQLQEARQKRQLDAPLPTWRRRFSNAAQTVPLSVLLTRDQNAVFENFFHHETKKGVLHFWMPDPTTDGWALLADDGSPLLISGGAQDGLPILLSALWLCSFADQLPSETIVGVEFRRTFNVVVYP